MERRPVMSGRRADGVLALRNRRVGSERAECRSAALGTPAGPRLSTCVRIVVVVRTRWLRGSWTVRVFPEIGTLARAAMMRRL